MEVVFLGSANCGKSSLINALLEKDLAKTSRKLSKTQDMKRYPIGPATNSKYILVDSPGYGFARAPLRVKKQFRKKIFQHVAYSKSLLKIYLLVSGHIGLKDTDIDILDQIDRFKRPIQIVLTKIDKINMNDELMTILAKTSLETQKYKSVLPTIHFTSTKNFIGIRDLRVNVALTFLDDEYNI